MSDFKLALTYLRTRMLVTLLTILAIALGLALATIVLSLSRQATETLRNEAGYWDVAVGAKGSPLQLVLNGLYYLEPPTGNIKVALWEKLKSDPDVLNVVPVNMGDNYLGSPIVGTVPEFFKGRHPANGGDLIASGRQFSKPFELVVGADVARRNHLKLGQQLVSAHGWAKSDDLHPLFPYTVVGFLAPFGTSLDRAVYTDYHSSWIVHAHPDADEAPEPGHDPSSEITTLLVRLQHPGLRFRYVEDINLHENAMAVIPVDEINKLMTTALAPMQGALLIVAYLVVFVSALFILVTLYLTIHQRRRDIAILRSLGATQANVFNLITVEAALLAGFGVIAGWVIGHAAMVALSPVCLSKFGIALSAWYVQPAEFAIAIGVWVLGILAGLLPAFMAYRLSVMDTLGGD